MTQRYDLRALKADLRYGPYAWPGGYPRMFILEDGDALSFDGARANFRELVAAMRSRYRNGWRVAGCEIHWEGPPLQCAATGAEIPSAYGDPNAEEDAQ